MNPALLSAPVQAFLQTHAHERPSDIALGKSPFPQVSSAELAEQIASRQRTRKKLPTWYQTAALYYPPALSIEQSSSEETAAYKARLIGHCNTLMDLTGGFGVDAYCFSKNARKVIHCEINPELSAIACYNLQQLSATNIECKVGDGMQLLQKMPLGSTDVVYVDPSRRIQNQKVYKLSDCEPNVVAHQDHLHRHAGRILVKAAPLLDIHSALSQLKHIKEIHVVGVKNEVKELLLLIEPSWEQPAQIVASGLNTHASIRFAFYPEEEKNAQAQMGAVAQYLYEPDATLLKAGCFKLISQRFDLPKLHTHTHLYTGEQVVSRFPGKCFRVIQTWEYAAFKKENPVRAASIVAKNFPLTAAIIRKKYRIQESSERFLFFYKDLHERLKTVLAERMDISNRPAAGDHRP